jgi:hypothetical protein
MPGRLFVNPFEFDKAAQFRDDHAFTHHRAARERGLVIGLRLAFEVRPDLTIRALAVPAEIPVGDRFYRKVLEAPEQASVFWDFDALAQDFYVNQFFVGV